MLRIVASAILAFLLTACERKGETYVCGTLNGERVEVQAVYSRLSGNRVAFEGKDQNGLPLRIDEKNSSQFGCVAESTEPVNAEDIVDNNMATNIN